MSPTAARHLEGGQVSNAGWCGFSQAILYEEGSHIVASGALATLSGAKTGRSPKDKRIVKEPASEADIWWRTPDNGSPNYEMDEQ